MLALLLLYYVVKSKTHSVVETTLTRGPSSG